MGYNGKTLHTLHNLHDSRYKNDKIKFSDILLFIGFCFLHSIHISSICAFSGHAGKAAAVEVALQFLADRFRRQRRPKRPVHDPGHGRGGHRREPARALHDRAVAHNLAPYQFRLLKLAVVAVATTLVLLRYLWSARR